MNNEKKHLLMWLRQFKLKLHKKPHTIFVHKYVPRYKKLVLALFAQYDIKKCNTLNVFVLGISGDSEIVSFISQNSP